MKEKFYSRTATAKDKRSEKTKYTDGTKRLTRAMEFTKKNIFGKTGAQTLLNSFRSNEFRRTKILSYRRIGKRIESTYRRIYSLYGKIKKLSLKMTVTT